MAPDTAPGKGAVDLGEVERRAPVETPMHWFLKCGCGRKSLAVLGLKDQAVPECARLSGFKRVGDRYWCRKCVKKARSL